MILQDTRGTGNGRKGEEDVVSVTISWVKKAVVQETPAEADFPSQEHCGLVFALPGCCLVLLSSLCLCLEES